MNSKNANLNIYEKHNYDPEKQKPKFAEAERIISRISTIPFKPKSKLLDVGCGIGIIGAKFKERYKLDVYGIDLAKSAIDLSKKNGIKATLGDLNKKWPYEDKMF